MFANMTPQQKQMIQQQMQMQMQMQMGKYGGFMPGPQNQPPKKDE